MWIRIVTPLAAASAAYGHGFGLFFGPVVWCGRGAAGEGCDRSLLTELLASDYFLLGEKREQLCT